jgi:hypothetical protein
LCSSSTIWQEKKKQMLLWSRRDPATGSSLILQGLQPILPVTHLCRCK